ncbi:MAG: TetR/AcrR family transcriptional regulator [Opitutaceae bacterium]|nr:TetR/AcrR family transcriptional regulator [Opitutaceae bacterium]
MLEPEVSSPKREHLMATAWRLFYRDGFRAVGIDTILAEAGVAKMTLYHHFASKEELIVALLEKRDRELRASIVATVDAAGKSPAKRLLAVFDWLEAWFGSADFNGCIFIRALSEYPEATHAIHRTAWNHKEAVKQMLAQLGEEAGARNPAALAETLSLLIDGAIVAAHGTRETGSARSARATAAALLKLASG